MYSQRLIAPEQGWTLFTRYKLCTNISTFSSDSFLSLTQIHRKTYILEYSDHTIDTLHRVTMCDIRGLTYARCTRNPKHVERGAYLYCPTAEARPIKTPCVPPSGKLRDLEITLDIQDTNLPGECPACAKRTPSNSSD